MQPPFQNNQIPFLNNDIDSSSMAEISEEQSFSAVTHTNSSSTGDKRATLNNLNNTVIENQINQLDKKKKKGMKSGKMHNKYKQKSNNKYAPAVHNNKKKEKKRRSVSF